MPRNIRQRLLHDAVRRCLNLAVEPPSADLELFEEAQSAPMP